MEMSMTELLFSREADAINAPEKFVLAPMDGMTRASFRKICFDYGADGATTEMIQSLALGRARRRLSSTFAETMVRMEGEGDLAAQLIGSRPDMMAASAIKLTAMRRFDAIEINMGCPARIVVAEGYDKHGKKRSGSGAALLKDVPLAIEIMRAVRSSTDMPLRLKLRMGWDSAHIVAPELCAEAQTLGFERITLHGRTREQMYSGEVDLCGMRNIVRSLQIPVFVNGAVTTAEDALAFFKKTGAADVSIGRAALKKPWIFADIQKLIVSEKPDEHDAKERIFLLCQLAHLSCRHRPEAVAVREMRKFSRWWLSSLTNADIVLLRLNEIETLPDYERVMEDYLGFLEKNNDLGLHSDIDEQTDLDTIHYVH